MKIKYSVIGDCCRCLIQSLPIRRRWAFHYLRRIAPRKPFIGQFRGGRIEIHPGEIASEEAYYYGVFERELTAWCMNCLHRDPGHFNLVVDVGANFGYYPILLGLVSRGRIQSIAFEPDPDNFAWLRRNLVLNPSLAIKCEQMGIGASDGSELTLRQFGEGFSGGTRIVSGVMEQRSGVSDLVVPCCKLDTYLNRSKIDKVSLTIIDVEGYEGNVIAGMLDGLSNRRYQWVVVELHPWAFASKNEMAQQVIDPFLSAGYTGMRFLHNDNPNFDHQFQTYEAVISDEKLLGPLHLNNMGGWQHFLFSAPSVIGQVGI